MTRYLTTLEVLYMHERTVERTGGTPGIRDRNLLDATLSRPRAVQGGTELYPTLAQKAAVLMYSLVLNHLFVDANKRVGLQCLDVFLRLNGVRLAANVADRYRFLVDVANEALSIPQMVAWIEEHAQPEDGLGSTGVERSATDPNADQTGPRAPAFSPSEA